MGGGRLLAPKVAPRRKIEKKKRIYKAQYTTYYEKIGEKENKGSFCVKNLLTYAIGKAEPVAVDIDTHGTGEYADAGLARAVCAVFDLTPDGMIRALGLDRPGFAQFCNYGNFTHQEAPWEQTDRGAELRQACASIAKK